MPPEEQFKSGALPDTRSEEEKLKDFKFKEVVATANPVAWSVKTPDQFRKFPIYNQNGSGSCVAQSMAKEMGIMRWLKDGVYVHFSAADLYQQRSNKPTPGMIAVDAHDIARKNGVTLEILSPSQNMTDLQMDSLAVAAYKKQVGSVFKISNYVELPLMDIETVASVIQTTNKGVMVWFYFKYDEWTDYPTIKHANLNIDATGTLRHSVTAVDFAIVNGKKSIIIEDSWGPNFGLSGQRVISEDFFKKRNFYAAYLTQFKFDDPITPIVPKPNHTFTKVMKFGDTSDDVRFLQDTLRFLGHYPINAASTGYYGAITSKAVLEFQKKYQVASVPELEALAGRTFGQTSLQKINALLM